MTTLRLVLHGKQAQNAAVRAAVEAERANGHQIEVRVTWEAGDSTRLAEEGSRLGFERVVAGGGDGTINEVAAGLLQARAAGRPVPTLGIVPLGTANDFARACGIPLEPAQALRLATTGDARWIDVGEVGERLFINLATGGFGTDITVETRPELKKLLHGAAYFITGVAHLAELRPVECRFTGPGFAWSGELLVLAVGNGRQAGGGHVLCPEALIDDGQFDVGILPGVPPSERPRALRAILGEGKAAIWRHAVTARIPWVELHADQPVQINLDGEPISGKKLRFEILAGALAVCLPKDAPVVSRRGRES